VARLQRTQNLSLSINRSTHDSVQRNGAASKRLLADPLSSRSGHDVKRAREKRRKRRPRNEVKSSKNPAREGNWTGRPRHPTPNDPTPTVTKSQSHPRPERTDGHERTKARSRNFRSKSPQRLCVRVTAACRGPAGFQLGTMPGGERRPR
jgi:hypothetical protein